ncbi:serine protease grass [Drosophila eugracilis]|uniref:serine protease grass n=1 Tax=Drosophila eugracilis TaxID=29029 RepID=UPI001BD9F171|nr:serine protease grass [Drosophila eugracilis]
MKCLVAWTFLVIHGSLAIHLLDPNCVKSQTGISYHIIHGQNADTKANQWMVQILLNGDHHCGGSLVTSRFVLTAAHCQSGLQLKARLIGRGGTTLDYDCSGDSCKPMSAEIDVDDMYIHPDYLSYHQNDIAMFRLAQSVNYTDLVRPICVVQFSYWEPDHYELLNEITTFNVTGWGKTERGYNSPKLLSTSLYNLDRTFCLNIYWRKIGQSHICAGHAISATCTGDSGGPLSAERTFLGFSRTFLFGLTSYGIPSCDQPSVFTNVLYYSRWIGHIVDKYTPN